MLYTIFIGTEQGKDGALDPIVATKGLQKLRLALAERFGGYSESDVKGAWFDVAAGRFIVERSIRFDVVTDEPPVAIKAIVEVAKVMLNQSSVLVIGAPVVAEFV